MIYLQALFTFFSIVIRLLIPGSSLLFSGRKKLAFFIPLLASALLLVLAITRFLVTAEGLVITLIMLLLLHIVSVFVGFILKKKKQSIKSLFLSAMVLSLVNITLAIGLYQFRTQLLGIEIYYIPSESMRPTLMPDDIVLADTWQNVSTLKKGDIIIFQHPHIPEMHLIKRIDFIVDKHHIRVIGDNPENSLDSRVLGNIDKSLIQAKATAVIRKKTITALGSPSINQ